MEIDNIIEDLNVQRRRTGILYLSGEPLYILEHTMSEQPDNDYVACFEIDKELYENSKGVTIAKQKVMMKPKQFQESSVLGRTANQLRRRLKKDPDKYSFKPAVYISKVERGKGFLRDEEGMGFYEYTADRVDIVSGKLVRGDRTGIFILLDYVEWGEPTIDMKALEHSIQNYGGDWHDL